MLQDASSGQHYLLIQRFLNIRSMAISPSTSIQASSMRSSATFASPGSLEASDLIHKLLHNQTNYIAYLHTKLYIYIYRDIHIPPTPTCKAICTLVNLTP